MTNVQLSQRLEAAHRHEIIPMAHDEALTKGIALKLSGLSWRKAADEAGCKASTLWDRYHALVNHASQNREEHLRMVYLEKHGHVPMTGPVSSKRDRFGNEVVETTLEAQSHNAMRDEMLARVLDRIQKKSRKKYGPDVALLVAFSPLGKPSEDDRKAYDEFARSELREIANRFPAIFLVSTFGDYVSSISEMHSAA